MTSAVHDIRYVCLSDLHLGEVDSILTPLRPGTYEVEVDTAGPLLEQLVLCLESAIRSNGGDRRPILILNGDALELAFGSFDEALMNFERLVKLLLDRELFERIVYVPGNHDHHIWEIARETQYGHAVERRDVSERLPRLRHVSSLHLEESVPAYLLNKVFDHVHPRHAEAHPEPAVGVVYPNLALVDDSGSRCVLFHHGHYVEPLYHFFSNTRRWLFPGRRAPQTIDELEEENFAWIDFVWSLLGRSGGAGADMHSLFRRLRNPAEFKEFADELARRTARDGRLRWIPTRFLRELAVRRAVVWTGRRIAGERTRRGVPYSPHVRRGIKKYLFGPTYRQLREELGHIPEQLTFVFGHTHKPFEANLPDPTGKRSVEVYNTGGWPIDTLRPSPNFGASILFMNEQLDLACLRVFNDGPRGGDVSLRVRRAGDGGTHGSSDSTGLGGDRSGDSGGRATDDGPGHDFRASIEARLRPGGSATAAREPWAELERLIKEAILSRRHFHEEWSGAAA